MELADERPVHAALVEAGEGPDPIRLLASDPAGHADRVAADVPQRAAALRRADPRVVRVGEEEGERPVHQLESSDSSAPGELHCPQDLWVVEVHQRLDGDPVRPFGRGRDGIDVLHGACEGLLAEHVLAGLQRADRPLRVQVVGQRDVDDVDVGGREERIVGSEGLRDAVGDGEGGRPIAIPAGDRDKLPASTRDDGPDQPGRDAARSEDAPAKGRQHPVLPSPTRSR